MMVKPIGQSNREETQLLDPFLKFILLVQLGALAFVGVDWSLQQFGPLPLTVSTHALVMVAAFYSARAVWQYHNQTVVPGLVDMTLRMGHQPDVIGPYNIFAYLASAWFFVAIGYGVHIGVLLGFIR